MSFKIPTRTMVEYWISLNVYHKKCDKKYSHKGILYSNEHLLAIIRIMCINFRSIV